MTCIVWDNSPLAAGFEDLAWLRENLPGFAYRHTPENVPLSRIYNTVIAEYVRSEESACDALLIADQDSIFEPGLLDEAGAALATHTDVSLFLPHVMANDAIVSPATVYGPIGLPWRTMRRGKIAAQSVTAINSGMIIRTAYLARRFSGYDERLRFYGTDNDFCHKYAKTERWLYALSSVLRHSLALRADETGDEQLWRHRENVRALRVVNSDDWIGRVTSTLYCAAYCSKMAIAKRDVRFLRWG